MNKFGKIVCGSIDIKAQKKAIVPSLYRGEFSTPVRGVNFKMFNSNFVVSIEIFPDLVNMLVYIWNC